MILKDLSPESIYEAAARIDAQGIPKDNVWNQYYLVVNGSEYPFKYIVSTAMRNLTESNFSFKSTENYRKHLQSLGFEIREYKNGYNFFTEKELQYFSEIAGKQYRKNNDEQAVYGQKLNGIIKKLQYWGEELLKVLPDTYKLREDNNWNNSGNVKSYFWPRIYHMEDRDVFFNIEVNGRDKFIGYKLDGYYKTKLALPEEQIVILNEFKDRNNTGFIKIPFSEIHQYNWDRLISETNAYLQKFQTKLLELKTLLKKEIRASRIIWNDNGWKAPSGWDGKSVHSGFESENGFGFDEWLFDESKELNGYMYGFLASVYNDYSHNIGKQLDIIIFTRNNNTRCYYWVGRINNVYILNPEEASEIVELYKKKGWYWEMQQELEMLGLDSTQVDEWANKGGNNIINIRFPIAELSKLNLDLPPIVDPTVISTPRYKLLKNVAEIGEVFDSAVQTGFNFDSGSSDADLVKSGKRIRTKGEVELAYRHNKLQTQFLKYLQDLYGKEDVKRECRAHGGCRIDISRRTPEGFVFYELKVFNSPRQSIREGIGQLLDYCLFPQAQHAKELVLVSDKEPDNDTKRYLNSLTQIITLPFSYIHFDIWENTVAGTYY